jgi:hypothetical protein
VLWKVDLGFLLKDMVLVGRNAVPKFTFALMKKIDS